MMRARRYWIAPLIAAAALIGCDDGEGGGSDGAPADAMLDGTGGGPAPDATQDATPDATVLTDAMPDAMPDARPDAMPDAIPDAEVVDAAADAELVDAAVDATVDADIDAVVDAEIDAVVDAEVDLGPPRCVDDGECDDGEICGVEGVCVPQPRCVDDGECDAGEICGFESVCAPAPGCLVDFDCADGRLCEAGLCRPAPACDDVAPCLGERPCVDGICAQQTCADDAACGEGALCLDGRCRIADCRDAFDCAPGLRCLRNLCIDGDCIDDGDCGDSALCFDNACAPGDCRVDEQCEAGALCLDRFCTPADCRDDVDCGPGAVCLDGVCAAGDCRSDDDCGPDALCEANSCVPGDCRDDDACGDGSLCLDLSCTPADCRGDGDCAPGALCLANICTPADCRGDAECTDGESCIRNTCVDGDCIDGADCADGQSCIRNACVDGDCLLDGDCGAGELCLDQQCTVADCRQDAECPAGSLCFDNQCTDADCRITDDCAEAQTCIRNDCVDGDCLLDGDCGAGELCLDQQCTVADCRIEDDCAPGESCIRNTCVLGDCIEDLDCEEGVLCLANTCTPNGCRADDDCAFGSLCFEQRCEEAECRDDGGCPAGQLCLDRSCISGDCRADEECGDGELCLTNNCTEADCRVGEDCPGDDNCVRNTCVDGDCLDDGDCAAGSLCLDNTCAPGDCRADDACADGELCLDNACTEADCRQDAECAADQLCLENICARADCRDDDGCAAGELCQANLCVPDPALASCRAAVAYPDGGVLIGDLRGLDALQQGTCGGAGSEQVFVREQGPATQCLRVVESDGPITLHARIDCGAVATETACVDAPPAGTGLTLDAAEGTTWFIFVDAPEGQAGRFTLNTVPGACPSTCEVDGECEGGQLCLDRLCRPAPACGEDGDCADGRICEGGRCAPPQCAEDADCAGAELCIDQRCVEADCRDDADCAEGLCFDNTCEIGRCRADEDCPVGLCFDTVCVADGCRADEDCAAGLCLDDRCVADGCRADEDCDIGLCLANRCAPNGCRDDGDCPLGLCLDNRCERDGCRADEDCDEGLCLDNRCVADGCREDVDCEDGICLGQRCQPGCRIDEQCADGELCIDDACIEGNCRVDDDCDGEICEANACAPPQCDGEDLVCPEGQICLGGRCAERGDFGDCAAPLDLPLGEFVDGTLDDAPSEIAGGCGGEGPESIYAFAPPFAGPYCIYVEQANFDSALSLRADCADGESELDCNDDGEFAGGLLSDLTFFHEPGETPETVFVLVEGLGEEDRGDFVVRADFGFCGEPIFCGDIGGEGEGEGEGEIDDEGPIARGGEIEPVDCPPGQFCIEGLCTPGDCAADPDCVEGERCAAGRCVVPECLENADCQEQPGGAGFVCNGFRCGPPIGTCEAPVRVRAGVDIAGTLAGAPSEVAGFCGGDGPEAVFLFEPDLLAPYCIQITEANFDTTLSVLTECDDFDTTLDCNDDGEFAGGLLSDLTIFPFGGDGEVPVERMFIYVESLNSGAAGDFGMRIDIGECGERFFCEGPFDCPPGLACIEGECGEAECNLDEDCPGEQICGFGLCRAPDCVEDDDCDEGELCVDGECFEPDCLEDADCQFGEGDDFICRNLRCIPDIPIGTCEAPLPAGRDPVEADSFFADSVHIPSCGVGGEVPEQVHSFTAARDGPHCAALIDAEFSATVSVRAECAAPDSELACAVGFEGRPEVSFDAVSGETYAVLVESFFLDDGGLYSLQVTRGACGEPPPCDFDADCLDDELCFEGQCALDPCGDAAVIDGPGIYRADNRDALPLHTASCGLRPDGPERIFRLNRDADGPVCLDTLTSSFDTVLSVRAAVCDDLISEVACNDDDDTVGRRQSRLTLDATAGTDYFVLVDGYDGATGDITLQMTEGPCDFDAAACLVDGDCAEGARCIDKACVEGADIGGCEAPMPIADFGVIEGNTRQNGQAVFGAVCGEGATSVEDVYVFTPAASGPVCFNLDGTLFDTVMHVRAGDCASTGAQVACNDDAPPEIAAGVASAITLDATAGTDYYVFVDGFGFARGAYSLEVSPGPCRPSCEENADCGLGEGCVAGGCAVACADDDGCAADERCVAGGCEPAVEAGTCAAPIVLDAPVGTHTATTSGAPAVLEPVCSDAPSGAEAVFAFTVEDDGALCVTTEGSGFDTVLTVQGEPCGGDRFIGCNDDSDQQRGSPFNSAVNLAARAGQTYYAIVDGVGGGGGRVVLDIREGKCRRPSFEGIRQDVPEAEILELGFEQCWVGRYNQTEDLGPILGQQCNQNVLLWACRPAGQPNLTLAAMGERGVILTDLAQDRNALTNHNGVDWYYSDTWSMGFVAEGSGVTRNSCDTNGNESEFRMCWHTGNGNVENGYRCGNAFPGNDYERLIYQRSGSL